MPSVAPSPVLPPSSTESRLSPPPPVDFTAFVDTGSDLIWTQCLPCINCFNQSHPIFNPRNSSSYRHVRCSSNICHSLDYSHCGADLRVPTCRCDYYYGDGSFTHGDLAFDQITIRSFKLPKVGPSDAATKTRVSHSTMLHPESSGLVPALSLWCLKSAKLPMSNQHSPTACQPNVSGKINFGRNAIISGSKLVSTPIISTFSAPFYYLTLEAISVANKRFEAVDNVTTATSKRGNILIDSGTTLTFLPPSLYNNIVSTLVSVIRAKRVEDPSSCS
ncbi:unnamed protein product [Citrullus colocynthis]|uniref:Peptidase A1 domain-containing protein n=1 Tax=Citrullus colocynthis TaxID=252529 RepID=A0ABP0YY33_9ROSI